jgi:hypothetical protein
MTIRAADDSDSYYCDGASRLSHTFYSTLFLSTPSLSTLCTVICDLWHDVWSCVAVVTLSVTEAAVKNNIVLNSVRGRDVVLLDDYCWVGDCATAKEDGSDHGSYSLVLCLLLSTAAYCSLLLSAALWYWTATVWCWTTTGGRPLGSLSLSSKPV